jgi:Flp pilus assembly protein TadG
MLPSARPGKKAKRPGATAVEFALVFLVFFCFLLGFIELGRGLMIQHLLTNAARAGCRTGVIEGKSTADIQTAATSVLTAQGIGTETVSVQVNDASADALTATVGKEITVYVSIPVANVTWVPGGSYLSGNLVGQYTLRRE